MKVTALFCLAMWFGAVGAVDSKFGPYILLPSMAETLQTPPCRLLLAKPYSLRKIARVGLERWIDPPQLDWIWNLRIPSAYRWLQQLAKFAGKKDWVAQNFVDWHNIVANPSKINRWLARHFHSWQITLVEATNPALEPVGDRLASSSNKHSEYNVAVYTMYESLEQARLLDGTIILKIDQLNFESGIVSKREYGGVMYDSYYLFLRGNDFDDAMPKLQRIFQQTTDEQGLVQLVDDQFVLAALHLKKGREVLHRGSGAGVVSFINSEVNAWRGDWLRSSELYESTGKAVVLSRVFPNASILLYISASLTRLTRQALR